MSTETEPTPTTTPPTSDRPAAPVTGDLFAVKLFVAGFVLLALLLLVEVISFLFR